MRHKENDNKSFLTRTDINFEKWSIFTTRKRGNERTLKRTNGTGLTQTVTISPFVKSGKQYTLTASECKLMYVLDEIWQESGRKDDKPVSFNLRQLAERLGLRWSGSTLKSIKRWLMNLRGVMITFENCYKTSKTGEIMETTEMMTILTHLKIFKRSYRKTGKPYWAFSEFRFHPYILKSLHNNFVKPMRLGVICQFRSDTAVILYRWLDLMLFRQNIVERELRNLAKELGLDYIRSDNFLKIVRRASAELVGKELVNGKIGYCQVKPLNAGTGWKLVVKKSGSTAGRDEELEEQERIEQAELDNYYTLLPQQEQYQIEAESQLFIREKYHGDTSNLTKELALYDAIKSHKEAGGNDGRFQTRNGNH